MNLLARVAALEAAVMALGRQAFEADGHDFHGNQWTGGHGDGKMSKARRKLHDALEVPELDPLAGFPKGDRKRLVKHLAEMMDG